MSATPLTPFDLTLYPILNYTINIIFYVKSFLVKLLYTGKPYIKNMITVNEQWETVRIIRLLHIFVNGWTTQINVIFSLLNFPTLLRKLLKLITTSITTTTEMKVCCGGPRAVKCWNTIVTMTM